VNIHKGTQNYNSYTYIHTYICSNF